MSILRLNRIEIKNAPSAFLQNSKQSIEYITIQITPSSLSRLYCRYWNYTSSTKQDIWLVDFTTGRELHPAPEDESIFYFLIHL